MLSFKRCGLDCFLFFFHHLRCIEFVRYGKCETGFNPFEQVVSVVVHSQLHFGMGATADARDCGVTIKQEPLDDNTQHQSSCEDEINYADLLNKGVCD